MLCFVAMIVFGILSIFSAKYRKYAKEAFKCVFLRATLRPCTSNLNEELRGKILTKLMKFPKLAKFTHRHFEAISWIFTITFFLSLGYTGYSLYNLAVHGTCDPATGHCIFVPKNATEIPENTCNITGEFIEFYGKECPHCAKMEPVVKKVENETGITFIKLEVWHNETNQKEMLKYSQFIQRDCKVLGVPTFFALKTNKSICGEVSEETLKKFIIENG
ncbi:MAG: thioredoxin family protein [Candidatus Nanoarchaeia archaeon]